MISPPRFVKVTFTLFVVMVKVSSFCSTLETNSCISGFSAFTDRSFSAACSVLFSDVFSLASETCSVCCVGCCFGMNFACRPKNTISTAVDKIIAQRVFFSIYTFSPINFSDNFWYSFLITEQDRIRRHAGVYSGQYVLLSVHCL